MHIIHDYKNFFNSYIEKFIIIIYNLTKGNDNIIVFLFLGGITILEKILDLIYPPVCGMCGEICKSGICEKCDENLKQRIKFSKIKYNNKEFNELVYFCKYEGDLREKILSYKFNNKAYLYKFFSEIIIKNEKEYSFFEKYDIIIPVPIHRKRKLTRGYNQTELIARNIAKKHKELKYMNVLYKQKHTIPQSSLNKKQREENVKNSYQIRDISLANKNVILFDDIYTTGATANECSRLLRQAGAKSVAVLTIAKD